MCIDKILQDGIGEGVELVTFLSENFQISKLNQLNRVVKMDVYYTIRPFERTPGKRLTFFGRTILPGP